MAARIAQRSLARRRRGYADEIRRLLDAAVVVMRRAHERGAKARVADIVAEAGLSNEAFYKHFASKDALVDALLEDGTVRLREHLERQLAKETTPEGQVRRWITGVLAQSAPEPAAATRAVLANAGGPTAGRAIGRHYASGPLAELLVAPFELLGSATPDVAAGFVAHAVLGVLADHLWSGTRVNQFQTRRLVELGLAVARTGG